MGAGQLRRNPKYDGPYDPQEPAALMSEALHKALENAHGAGAQSAVDLLAKANILAIVDPLAWGYNDVFHEVANRVGLPGPYDGITVAPGGNSPGELMNTIVQRISDGQSEVAVLTGAECMYSRRRARRENSTLNWTPFEGRRDFLKGQRELANGIESRHLLTAPVHCYPLFENALRAKARRSVHEHQLFLGEFMARNTDVAASNPFAWFPHAQSPEAIATVGPENRMICFPYPKRMNAIMEVDMAAAVVIMSDAEADRQGIPAEKRVTILGAASATDAWCITEREDFTSSPALAVAFERAFAHAGCSVNEIDLFDLYSCFPSAIQIALAELRVDTNDPRGVTVTGGLAYAGGPGNNYPLHGLAAMVERLRNPSDPASTGLTTSLGNVATKHAVQVLSVDPVKIARSNGQVSAKIPVTYDAPDLVDEVSGQATVETFTILYDRGGEPEATVFVLRLAGGQRTVAHGRCTASEVALLTMEETIGRSGFVTAGRAGPGETNIPNRFELDGV